MLGTDHDSAMKNGPETRRLPRPALTKRTLEVRMANRADITAEVCRQLLDYDPETGVLRWKHRDALMFSACGRWSAFDKAAAWNARHAGRPALTANSAGYRVGSILNIMSRAHVVAWMISYGVKPILIDHINGDRSDNRLSNPRNVDATGNSRNTARQARNRSGSTGVRQRPNGKWEANIGIAGRFKFIGHFETFAEASDARKRAAAEHGFHDNHGRPQ